MLSFESLACLRPPHSPWQKIPACLHNIHRRVRPPCLNPPFKTGQRIALLDLAPELITLICTSSEDWGTVFALKKVCRILNRILNDWTIWTHLVSICMYSPSRHPRHLFVDRCISKYNACELKAILMRWKKVERGWKSAHRQDFEIRRLPMPAGSISHSRVFVPGGRWLILFSHDFSASYFDLDFVADTTSPLPLIPLHNTYGSPSFHVSDPDIDQASPVLSFRIALSYAGDDADQGPSFVEIWNITSVYDDDAKTPRLDAHKIAAFQLDLACGLLAIYTLAGDNVLFAAFSMFIGTPEYGNGDRRLLLVNWRKPMNTRPEPCYRTVLIPNMVTWEGVIINEDHLLIATSLGIKLVNCQGIPERSTLDCHLYHHPASLGHVNYGIMTDIAPTEFVFMSQEYCHNFQSAGQTKKIFFADEEGNLGAVTYNCGSAATNINPSFTSAGLISYAGVSSVLFGHNQILFAHLASNSCMVVPDALLAKQNLNDNSEITPEGSFSTCVSVHRRNQLDRFDEGIGRILTYSRREMAFYIADMIV